jgi:hypothetical protein
MIFQVGSRPFPPPPLSFSVLAGAPEVFCLNAPKMAWKHRVALVLARPKKAVATLAVHVFSMTTTANFFTFWHLRTLHAGRYAQAATIQPVTVVLARAPMRSKPAYFL